MSIVKHILVLNKGYEMNIELGAERSWTQPHPTAGATRNELQHGLWDDHHVF